MKDYKGSNKKMYRNYVADKQKNFDQPKTYSLRKLSYEELIDRKGEFVYVMYSPNIIDYALVYEADEKGITFWGRYDENGDAIISIIPPERYGLYAVAFVRGEEIHITVTEELLESFLFPNHITKTIMEHFDEKVQQREDND